MAPDPRAHGVHDRPLPRRPVGRGAGGRLHRSRGALLAQWIPFVSGRFVMDPRLFAVMAASRRLQRAHLRRACRGGRLPPRRPRTHRLDRRAVRSRDRGHDRGRDRPVVSVLRVRRGRTSGMRGGLRQADDWSTAVNLGLYICLILSSRHGSADIYIMRPVLPRHHRLPRRLPRQQRLELQEQMRQLEVAEQRHRIARELHDGYAQALAGINLRLEGSRRLLRADGVAARRSPSSTDLQDERATASTTTSALCPRARGRRADAGRRPSGGHRDAVSRRAPRSRARSTSSTTSSGIAREGLSNVQRHATRVARTARSRSATEPARVRIDIEDDGVGFAAADVTPWSIASRVREIGGRHRDRERPAAQGAHLSITLPTDVSPMQRPIRPRHRRRPPALPAGSASRLLKSEPDGRDRRRRDRPRGRPARPPRADAVRPSCCSISRWSASALADIETLVRQVPVVVLDRERGPADAVAAIREAARARRLQARSPSRP